MRTEAYDILPTPVRRSLKKLGRDIQVARKRRRLTIAMRYVDGRRSVLPSAHADTRPSSGSPPQGLGARISIYSHRALNSSWENLAMFGQGMNSALSWDGLPPSSSTAPEAPNESN